MGAQQPSAGAALIPPCARWPFCHYDCPCRAEWRTIRDEARWKVQFDASRRLLEAKMNTCGTYPGTETQWKRQMEAYRQALFQAGPEALHWNSRDQQWKNPVTPKETPVETWTARRIAQPITPLTTYTLGPLTLTRAEVEDFRGQYHQAELRHGGSLPVSSATKLYASLRSLDEHHEITAPRTYDYEVHNGLIGPKRQNMRFTEKMAQDFVWNWGKVNLEGTEYMNWNRSIADALRAAGVVASHRRPGYSI